MLTFGNDGNIKFCKGLCLHCGTNHTDGFLFIAFIHLKQQFIMNLQNGPDLGSVLQLFDQLLHGQLQNFCCRALDGGIHAAPFGKAALAPVRTIIDIG